MIDANNTKLHEMWSTSQRQTLPRQEAGCPQGNNSEGFGETGPYFHEGSSSRDGIHTKPMKLEFSHIDGEDPETWSCRAM